MGRNTKKSQVVEAAEELFMKFGMKRVTVKEICEKADVSKMTFYNHFDNKNDIIKYIFNSWLDEGYAWLEELEKQNLSFREEIQKILEYKKSYTSRMSPQFIDEYLKDSPELEDFFERYRQRGVESFIDWIESCKERGKVRKSIKSEFLVYVFNMIFNLVKDENIRSLYPSISDLIEDIFEFIFYGIVPEKNREYSNAE
ncbi:MAG TPA: TetR/AcrR family transcriptional regulator [bacterium]|nr:TetR/AcrR family transcriptional regulator [bacterium]